MTDLTVAAGRVRIASVDLLRGLVMVIRALALEPMPLGLIMAKAVGWPSCHLSIPASTRPRCYFY